MDVLFVEAARTEGLLQELLRERAVFAAGGTDNGFHWQKLTDSSSASLAEGSYRSVEPIKTFFFPPRSVVAAPGGTSPPLQPAARPTVLAGAKACDLRALEILDHVFAQGDFVDPFYVSRRENTLIVASDCTEAGQSCFCTALGIKPYPEEGYDLAVSRLSDGGLVVSVGSDKGEALVHAHASCFRPATQEELREREGSREAMVQKLAGKVSSEGLPDPSVLTEAVKRNWDSEVWEKHAGSCVECGACNLVCATCHCFVLQDYAASGGGNGRAVVWDSCQYKSFARVAGGANPRGRLAQRIRNRFDKKFVFFPQTMGMHACTGCGRCVEACIAGIDIRDVLKEVASA